MRRLALASLCLVLAADSPAIERMRRDVLTLAAPDMEGRGHATPGLRKAAAFVASELKKMGLQPQTQEVPIILGSTFEASEAQLHLADGRTLPLAVGKTLGSFGHLEQLDLASAPLVFVGFGQTLPEKGYDDLAGLDLKGAVAVVDGDIPDAGPFKDLGWAQRSTTATLTRLKAAGAVAAIVVPPATWKPDLAGALNPKVQPLPGLLAPGDALPEWSTLAEARAELRRTFKPQSRPMTSRLSAHLRMTLKKGAFPNVVAHIPGTDAGLKDEQIVLGAHMDHLGSRTAKDGTPQIFFGADDNASGTAMALEMARRLTKKPLRRGAVVAIFGGEERGLLGSRHWVEHPTVPLAQVKAMFNFDVVGRIPKERPVALLSAPGTPAATVDEVLRLAPVGIYAREELGLIPGGSDHLSFASRRIPTFFFCEGMHEDIHRVTDTPDKLNYEAMSHVADWAERSLRTLDSRDRMPAYRPSPSLGLQEAPTDGYKIQRVSPGSTAEALGLKPGDILFQVNATSIDNATDLTLVLQELEVGTQVKARWMRGQEQMEGAAKVLESKNSTN